MCDYSLESISSRPAAVEDKLIVSSFRNSTTRGFAAQDTPGTAVCIMPGTELAFDNPIATDGFWALGIMSFWHGRYCTAIFRKVNMHSPTMHHDALELPSGQIVMLTRLKAGQTARVIQLPAQPAKPGVGEKVTTEAVRELT
jgi:hypothetical protein